MSAQVPAGIGAPNLLYFPIVDLAGQLDLTTVTAVAFTVQVPAATPGGAPTQTTWTGAIVVGPWPAYLATILGASGPTATALLASHAFASGDCVNTGIYLVAPQLTVPGGTINVYARPLTVTTIFGM